MASPSPLKISNSIFRRMEYGVSFDLDVLSPTDGVILTPQDKKILEGIGNTILQDIMQKYVDDIQQDEMVPL